MAENEKLVIISTIGDENPEKATLPFVLATAAQSMDVEVVVILQSSAVVFAKNGEAEKVNAKGFMPLKNLLETFIELGGLLMLCTPCIKERNISPDDLIKGSVLVAAGSVATEVMSAKSVVTY
jgi:predicted peroxiredoxin